MRIYFERRCTLKILSVINQRQAVKVRGTIEEPIRQLGSIQRIIALF